jgi:hypothetical protein
MTAGQERSGVFLSVAEGQKVSLARPFRDLLRPAVEGYIVSDLPHRGETYTPEEKVDAYLERSQAVVVFATADLDTGVDRNPTEHRRRDRSGSLKASPSPPDLRPQAERGDLGEQYELHVRPPGSD